MSGFMDKDFLLKSKTAKMLYHEYASKMPIIDYHCHLSATDIYNNKRFNDIAEIWLAGDHYKWRLMRACGVSEEYITENASGRDKFMRFAEVLPLSIGNPIYHWAHLELQRFFGINKPLTKDTADEIWGQTCDILSKDNTLSARGVLERMNVKALITTDDPIDTLQAHKDIAQDISISTKVLPAFRPDGAMNIEFNGFCGYIAKLSVAAGQTITNFDDLKTALKNRIDYFNNCGCKAADHGFLNIPYAPTSETDVDSIFVKALSGDTVSLNDADKYKYALFMFLASEYARLGWVMELHLGVVRNVNSVMFDKIGADTGFDSIGVSIDIPALAKIFDALNKQSTLPKTLVFSINPNDNDAINTLCACYNAEGIRGKVQQGSAWWFNDSLGGMRAQMQSFAQHGVLGNFIGMLTDSRSFTSYTRHEYFRRILCSFIGDMVDDGLYPDDICILSDIVKNICYNNVKEYFSIDN